MKFNTFCSNVVDRVNGRLRNPSAQAIEVQNLESKHICRMRYFLRSSRGTRLIGEQLPWQLSTLKMAIKTMVEQRSWFPFKCVV